MELTREDLVCVLKGRLSRKVDLRFDNPYATYNDQYGRVSWKEEFFTAQTDEQLKELINKHN